MASYYVYSGAVGTGTGASWANAYTTLAAAMSGKATGDVFFVANDHSESNGSAVTISSPLAARVLCVNRAGSVPPVAADLTTGVVLAAVGNYQANISGAYWYGLLIRVTGTGTGGTQLSGVFENCRFEQLTTNNNLDVQSGCIWKNCVVKFANSPQTISLIGSNFTWRGGSFDAATATPQFGPWSNGAGRVLIEGVDLSATGFTSKEMLGNTSTNQQVIFKDCKFAPSAGFGSPQNAGEGEHIVLNSDNASTNYRFDRRKYPGSQVVETTIVRSAGASDGATAFSHKIVTNANAGYNLPFDLSPISIWNDTTGVSKTVTIEGVWNSATPPNDNDIWIEVEYLGNASFPLGSVASSASNILAPGAALPASSATWTTTGLGTPGKFSLSVSFTPQKKGLFTIRVYAAKASSTFYIDPKPTVA